MAMWIVALRRAAEAEDNPSRLRSSRADSLQEACRWQSVKLDPVLSEALTRSVTGQPESPEAIREKQSGGWDIGSILLLHHHVQAGLLTIISSAFSVCIHYFIWDILITPNLEKKSVLLLWSPPWKLTYISKMELRWTISLLTSIHLQHNETLLLIFTFVFIFSPHSFKSHSNPSLLFTSFHWGFDYFHIIFLI